MDTVQADKTPLSERKEQKERAAAADAPRDGAPSLLTSAVLIGIGALIEPELLVGMAIGGGLVYASKYLPDLLGGVVRPAVKTVVKAGYAAAEVVSEATEHVQDMFAEVRAERSKEAAQR